MKVLIIPVPEVEIPTTMSPRKISQQSRDRLALLLDTYGALLTEKQARMIALYAKQGVSFAEIGRREGVSRQAVHDAVRHGEKLLEEYDGKLRITKASHPHLPPQINGAKAIERIQNLKARIAHQGIIYSADWIVAELNEIQRLVTE